VKRGWLLGLLLAGCGGDGNGESRDPFDQRVLTTYELTLAPADWDAMVADPFDNTWRRCTVVWQGETYADVAIRPSGERSRIPGNPKPSLRLEFDEFLPDREFHQYSTLKLDAMTHDPSMMRARLQYPYYEAAGVPAPKYVHCRVVVNGQLKGLYGVEERIGREFLKKRFGRPLNQYYEFREATADLEWWGPDPSNYVPLMWIPDFDDVPPGAESVRDLHDVLNNDPGQASTVFDVNRFLAFMAAEVLQGESDAYLAGPLADDVPQNLFLYKDPATNRYLFLPWDRDQGFLRENTSITFGFERRILTRNLILNVPDALDRYRAVVRKLIDGPCSTAAIQARVDSILAQIEAGAAEDPLKPYSTEEFHQRVQEIRRYVEQRNAAFQAQLSAP
jgi:spore coat protein CotH